MGCFHAWKAITVAVVVSLLGSVHARVADEVTYKLGWLPQGSQARIFLTTARGYYAAENLDVKIVRGYGYLRTENEMDQGLFEFGVGEATAVLLNRSNAQQT